MNKNSLNIKLNRIDETLLLMKNNLGLSENEVIENLAEATNLHTLANIFIQEEEPEIKDGIWIKAKAEDYPYDTIRIDADTILTGRWRYDNALTNYPSKSFMGNEWCEFNGKIYFRYMYNTNSTGLKIYEMDLDVTPATITTVYDNSSQKISCASNDTTRPFTDGTYIYFPGGQTGGVYRFEPISKTCVFLNTLPSGYPTTGSTAPYFSGGCYNPWNNCIYITGPWGNKMAEYNLETAEIRSVYDQYNGVPIQHVFPMKDKLLCIMGRSPYVRIMDIESKTVTAVSTSLKDKPLYGASFIDMGDYWYAINELNDVIKINKTTLEYEDITTQFSNGSNGDTVTTVVRHKNKFYAISKDSNDKYTIINMDATEASYDENMLVIMQAPITRTEKQTALWTYPCLKGRMCQSFYDIYYYNKDTGYNYDLTTYYGNGTE